MALELDPTIIQDTSLLTLFDQRLIGSELPRVETYTIPTNGIVLLREAPQQISLTIPTGITITQVPGGPFVEVSSSPATGQFTPNYTTGKITFNTADAGLNMSISYNALGSVVTAAHVNNVITPLTPFFNKLDTIVPDAPATPVFTFPNDVNILGDLNVTGVVNKTAAEVLDLTDDILLMNSGQGPGPDVGLEIDRGGAAQGDPLHPQFLWIEANDTWDFLSTSSGPTGSAGFQLFSVRDSGGVQVTRLTTAQETTLVGGLGATDGGLMWFNTTTSQFKGWNGTAQAIIA